MTLAHVVFLMHFRSILIVTIPLPLAVLMSFLGHVLRRDLVEHHEPRRHCHRHRRARGRRHRRHRERVPLSSSSEASIRAIDAWSGRRCSSRRGSSAGQCSSRWPSSSWPSCPVFALTGQEGKLFHPLAFTKTFAVLAATIISVTLVPVLCTLLLGGTIPRRGGQPGHARAAAALPARARRLR